MTHRERLLATVLGQPRDRVPYFLYWGVWGATWARWQREGLPAQFKSFTDVRAHFGADEVPRAIPVRLGPVPDLSAAVSEDADSVTRLDSWGIKHRNLRGSEGMPEFLAWPVTTRDEWRRYRNRH